jgi:hypothetical protein
LRPFRTSDFYGISFHETKDIVEPYAVNINYVADRSRSNAMFTVLLSQFQLLPITAGWPEAV